MARLSGLQRSVLSLYRKCLRETRRKPSATQDNWVNFVRTHFRRNVGVDKKDFATIEFLLRQGQHKLETYSDPGVKNISI